MKSAFSQNLVRIRNHWELTQEQAAYKIGIKRPTLGAYEEGRAEPSLEILQKIIKAYDIVDPMAFLFDRDFLQEQERVKVFLPSLSQVEMAYSRLTGKERIMANLLLGLAEY